ncbi:MAG: hypothetical protein ABEJ72_07230, partial [Candidatus Aenigmatarchaeota archaeon]
MSRSKAALVAVTVLVLVSASAAIEINSSKSLKYYSGGDLDFKVGTDGTVDLKGGILEDSNGPLQLDAEVEIKNGNLDMTGNGIVNTGQIDGVDVDNPGDAIVLSSSRYTVPSDAIGNSELNNSQRMDLDGVTLTNSLNVNGQRVRNVPAPQGPGDAVNKSFVTLNDDTIADDQTLQDVLGQGNSAGNFNIDASSQDVYGIRRLQFADRNSDSTSFNITESSGDLVVQKDGNVRFKVLKSGGAEVSGNLGLGSNAISGENGELAFGGGNLDLKPSGSSNIVLQTSNTRGSSINFWNNVDSQFMMKASNSGPITFNNPVTGTTMLEMNSTAGNQVRIPNGDLKASGDDLFVDHSSGNVGIKTSSPSYPLTVDGDARVYGNLTVE